MASVHSSFVSGLGQHCGVSVEQDGYENIGQSTSKPAGQVTFPSEQVAPPEEELDEDEGPPLEEDEEDDPEEEVVEPDEDEVVVEHCNDPQSIKHSPKYVGLL